MVEFDKLIREANRMVASVKEKVQEKGFDSIDEFIASKEVNNDN